MRKWRANRKHGSKIYRPPLLQTIESYTIKHRNVCKLLTVLNAYKFDLLSHLSVNSKLDFVTFTEGIRDINDERCIIVQVDWYRAHLFKNMICWKRNNLVSNQEESFKQRLRTIVVSCRVCLLNSLGWKNAKIFYSAIYAYELMTFVQKPCYQRQLIQSPIPQNCNSSLEKSSETNKFPQII